MSETSRALLDTALGLPVHERAILAAGLVDSLDPGVAADHDQLWKEEVARRLDSGEATTFPWSVARQMIMGRESGGQTP